MVVIAWNNGAHSRNGVGYGFKVIPSDREVFFKKEWDKIILDIPGEAAPVEIQIDKEQFWGETPRELHSAALGKWLRHNGMAPWGAGNPPRFILEPVEDNHFKVMKSAKEKSRF